MGDKTELQAIAAELEDQSGNTQSLSRRIVELAEAIDLDGLAELARAYAQWIRQMQEVALNMLEDPDQEGEGGKRTLRK